MKGLKFVAPVVTFIGGFLLGAAFDREIIKKHIKKMVSDEWNTHLEEKNEVKPPENASEKPILAEFEAISSNYRSSDEESSDKIVHNNGENVTKNDEKNSALGEENETKMELKQDKIGEGETAEMVAPFRSGAIKSGVTTVPINEFYNAENREFIDYYVGDDLFINEDGAPVEDAYGLFGYDILDYFGTTSDDPDSVHVYNKEQDMYYEITRRLGFFDPK